MPSLPTIEIVNPEDKQSRLVINKQDFDPAIHVEWGQQPSEPTTDSYSIVDLGSGWFDVVGPDGETVNDTKLRHNQAELLVEHMTKNA